jgi:hypothetical protein
LNYTSFENVHGNGDMLYMALYNNVAEKIYEIDDELVIERAEDMKVGDFMLYFPKDTSIIYLAISGKVYVLFGRYYSKKSFSSFLGILGCLEKGRETELELKILTPKFNKRQKWHKVYMDKIENLKTTMTSMLSI